MESDMFNYCILSNIHLERSSLEWVRMEDCVTIGMSWKENYITGAKFIRCNFSHSKFKETEFHKCVFIDCIIQDVTLTRVSFCKMQIQNCIFTEFPEDKKEPANSSIAEKKKKNVLIEQKSPEHVPGLF